MLTLLVPDKLGRLLFHIVFERISDFLSEHVKEVDAEQTAYAFMRRWLSFDPAIFIFVRLEDGKITAHCLCEILNSSPQIFYVHQVKLDHNKDKEALQQGMAKIELIAKSYGISYVGVVAETPAHTRLYQKQLDFKLTRYILTKELKQNESIASEAPADIM